MRIDDFGENTDGGKWTFCGGNLVLGGTLNSIREKMGDHRLVTVGRGGGGVAVGATY